MADETFNPRSQDRQPGASRGGRGGGRDQGGREQGGREQGGRDQGGREPGGFRIRLSENEMRAARAVQEAFGLRSTVAALGMALRTTAQLLELGQLDEQVAQHKAQAPSRGEGPRGDDRRDGGPRQGGRGDGRAERAPRVDPFARPSRPAPAVAEPAQPETTDEAVSAELDETAAADAIDASPDSNASPDSDTSPATDTAETTTEA
jgi:hypothetical protein